jgi:endonuclease G
VSFSGQQEYQRQAAAARFKETVDERKLVKAQLKLETAFAVDTDARGATRRALISPNDGFGLERIVGLNDLVAINYLSLGLNAAKSVCRIHIRDGSGRPAGFGSGFMVSPILLLTNHHVLEDLRFALRSLAEFDFETDIDFIPKPTRHFRLDPEQFFYNNLELDFALVAVHPQALDGTPLSQFGFLSLIPQTGKVLVGEAVSIIQHPEGADKHVAIRSNHILSLHDDFIHYETDTMPGSSGSPVLNDQWQVAALHHSGVPRVNAQGKILTKDELSGARNWETKLLTGSETKVYASVRFSITCALRTAGARVRQHD